MKNATTTKQQLQHGLLQVAADDNYVIEEESSSRRDFSVSGLDSADSRRQHVV